MQPARFGHSSFWFKRCLHTGQTVGWGLLLDLLVGGVMATPLSIIVNPPSILQGIKVRILRPTQRALESCVPALCVVLLHFRKPVDELFVRGPEYRLLVPDVVLRDEQIRLSPLEQSHSIDHACEMGEMIARYKANITLRIVIKAVAALRSLLLLGLQTAVYWNGRLADHLHTPCWMRSTATSRPG
jgi:hypothetical protein